MIRGMSEMGYDAVAIGERDLQLGRETLLDLASRYSLPLVCANVIDTETKKLLVQPYVIVERGGKSFFGGGAVKIGIFGVLSPRYLVPVNRPGETPLKATDPIEASKRVIGELKKKGCNAIIALAHVTVPEASRIASIGGIAAIVMGHSTTHLRDPRFDNGAIVIQGGREGRYIGDVQFEIDPHGGVVSVEGEVPALGKEYKDDPHFAALISQYKKALEVRKFAPHKTSQEGVNIYVGSVSCGTCHLEQLEQWRGTAHARAFATLVKKGSQFDPECVGCHVTGYGRGNGFHDAKSTPAMANVQCEECHGPGMQHFRYQSSEGKQGNEAEATFPEITKSVCVRCHKGDRDPDFDYEKKIGAVAH